MHDSEHSVEPPVTLDGHLPTRRQIIAFATAAGAVGGLAALARPSAALAADSVSLKMAMPEATPQATLTANSAWGGYSNGQIPTSVLASVPASIGPYLRPDAAAAYFALSDAFNAVFGEDLAITEAYRDLARQEYLYDGWINKEPGFNLAAKPGTSIHGWALASDFGSGVNTFGTGAKIWTDANGPTYGWIPTGNSFSPREPWHYEYDGSYTPATPPTPIEKIADMKLLTAHGRYWLVGEFTASEINSTFAASLGATYGTTATASDIVAELEAELGDAVSIEYSANIDARVAISNHNYAKLIADIRA